MSESVMLDSQRMFEHACAFCDCAKFCEVEPNNIEYRMRSHTVSGIVNSAFACEVFIKTLLVFHGKTISEIKGHKLKTLWKEFKMLDNATAAFVEERMREWFNSTNANMFDEKQLAGLDHIYFNIICADDRDVTIQSRNTGHYWYLHNTGYPSEGSCIIFHKHRFSHPYHQHGRARTLRQAVKSIKQHDEYQLKVRKTI